MVDERIPTILLFGAPGVGKGTQGNILGAIPGFYHLACGDVFRSLNIRSPEGKEIYRYSAKGDLVPDELTVKIWSKALHGRVMAGQYHPPEELLILDGIPRNVNQAKMVAEHIQVLHVLHLICSDEEAMIDRIKRRAIRDNRYDDANEDVIRRRFEVYRGESEEVINVYPPEMISRIDAMGSPSEVLNAVLSKIIPVQNSWLAGLSDVNEDAVT